MGELVSEGEQLRCASVVTLGRMEYSQQVERSGERGMREVGEFVGVYSQRTAPVTWSQKCVEVLLRCLAVAATHGCVYRINVNG